MGPGRVTTYARWSTFLVNVIIDQPAAPPPITVITNWTATLALNHLRIDDLIDLISICHR